MAEKKWAGTTYGSVAMHRWLIRLLRVVDVRAVYVFAFVCVIPVCVFLPGFRHSMHFFRSRRGNGRLKSFVNAYRNHCVFAEAVIDKFAMYAGKRFDISMEGEEHFKRLASRPESFMMLRRTSATTKLRATRCARNKNSSTCWSSAARKRA